MSENTVRERIESGDAVVGTGAATFTPSVVEVYGHIGLDFVWIDLEHSGGAPYDSEMVENLARAADASGTELVVRIPSNDPSMVRKVLDTGVRNIVIPRVKTAEEVARAIKAATFSYDGTPGERGVGFARASIWGERLNPEYPAAEDDTVSVGAMIEHEDAMENLDDILAVPHLGFVFMGHYDLTMSMDLTDPDEPAVQETIADFQAASRDAGVPFGQSVGSDIDAIRDVLDEGCQIVTVGNEIMAARQVFTDLLERL